MIHRQCLINVGYAVLFLVCMAVAVMCVTACYKPTFVVQMGGTYYEGRQVPTSQPSGDNAPGGLFGESE